MQRAVHRPADALPCHEAQALDVVAQAGWQAGLVAVGGQGTRPSAWTGPPGTMHTSFSAGGHWDLMGCQVQGTCHRSTLCTARCALHRQGHCSWPAHLTVLSSSLGCTACSQDIRARSRTARLRHSPCSLRPRPTERRPLSRSPRCWGQATRESARPPTLQPQGCRAAVLRYSEQGTPAHPHLGKEVFQDGQVKHGTGQVLT